MSLEEQFRARFIEVFGAEQFQKPIVQIAYAMIWERAQQGTVINYMRNVEIDGVIHDGAFFLEPPKTKKEKNKYGNDN